MVKEALKAQTSASESLRPSKRRKPNSHSAGAVSSISSPRKKFGRSDTPTPKGHSNLNVDSSDDDIEQAGSEPSASKAVSQSTMCAGLFGAIVLQGRSSIECPVCAKGVLMARINDHLDSNCKYYLSSGKTASSSKSEQKDAWSKLLDGKKSGKEKSALIFHDSSMVLICCFTSQRKGRCGNRYLRDPHSQGILYCPEG